MECEELSKEEVMELGLTLAVTAKECVAFSSEEVSVSVQNTWAFFLFVQLLQLSLCRE